MSDSQNNDIIVVFRNDDPSARCDVEHEKSIASVFQRYGCPQTLGVVPFMCLGDRHDPAGRGEAPLDQNPDMVAFLREYVGHSGSEIALHGCTHRTNRHSLPSRREHFEFQRLSRTQQEDMIARGADLLTRVLGVRPTTFIPPWNRLDMETLGACGNQKFRAVSSGPFVPEIDSLLPVGANCDLATFLPLLEAARRSNRPSLLVVNYHSPSLLSAPEIEGLDRALAAASSTAQCKVVTIAQAAAQHRELARKVNDAARDIAPQDEVPRSPRGSVVFYRRVVSRLGVTTALERAYSEAAALYHQSRYDDVRGRSGEIDRRCARWLVGGRGASAGIGLLAAIVATVIERSFGEMPVAAILTGFFAVALPAAWSLLWLTATSRQTKAEVRTAGLLCLGTFCAGLGLAQLLPIVLGQ